MNDDEQRQDEEQEEGTAPAVEPLSPEEASEGAPENAGEQDAGGANAVGHDPGTPRATSAPDPQRQSGVPAIPENEGVEAGEQERPTGDAHADASTADGDQGQ